MHLARRTYWSFLIALMTMTFAVAQLWSFILALRRHDVQGVQVALGVVSIPLLVVSAVVVLRILYVTACPRRQQ